MYKTIKTTESAPGCLEIRMNRPDVRNALDEVMIAELTEAFEAATQDPKVRVILLAGEGKIFCAGADLGWMRRMAGFSYDENLADAEKLANLFETIDRCPKPTVALVQGGAYGGGVGLVSVCDITVAEEGSSFALTEVRLGIIPAVISPYIINAIGQRQARRFTLTAERLSVEQALSVGLVHEVVKVGELYTKSQKIVQDLLQGSPEAQAATKKLYRAVESRPISTDLKAMTTKAIAEARASNDGKEGLQAFLDKRSPKWATQ